MQALAALRPANDTAADPHRAAREAATAREQAYQARHVWTGALYAEGRDVADVAKLVRADLRAAGIVARVTVQRYSQGQSITVLVQPPAGMALLSTLRIRQDLGLAPVPATGLAGWQSVAARGLIERVEAMANAYCRSWSDRHQAFHVHCAFAGSTEAERAEIVAALRGAAVAV